MRFRPSALAVVLVAVVGGASMGDADAAPIYRLREGSSFQTACFAPCDCPSLDPAPMRGVFELSPVAFGDVVDVYSVDEVDWTTVFNGSEMRITGSGRYRIAIDGSSIVQQLELDLRVGDGEVQHFNSGLVPITAVFPKLDVTVSLHGMFCADTVIRVEAAPVRRSDILRYRLVAPSTFEEGCVAPCACPTGPMLPVRGAFRIVRLIDEPPFAQYAVVGVRWRLIGGDPRRIVRRIRGSGRYTLFSEFAVLQDLSLDLFLGQQGPVRFRSGLVLGGGDFPAQIDVQIVNGSTCFERRIALHAMQISKR